MWTAVCVEMTTPSWLTGGLMATSVGPEAQVPAVVSETASLPMILTGFAPVCEDAQ